MKYNGVWNITSEVCNVKCVYFYIGLAISVWIVIEYLIESYNYYCVIYMIYSKV